jgi:predicted nuclease of predicted toxin-antitoxin system
VRLLVDANLSPRIAKALVESGHDAVHVFDLGLADASDAVILQRAADEHRVVVSSDTDFGALLARSQSSEPSFVLLRHVNDLGVDDQALLLVAVLPTVAGELERGAVVTLSRGRVRTRRLPFGASAE